MKNNNNTKIVPTSQWFSEITEHTWFPGSFIDVGFLLNLAQTYNPVKLARSFGTLRYLMSAFTVIDSKLRSMSEDEFNKLGKVIIEGKPSPFVRDIFSEKCDAIFYTVETLCKKSGSDYPTVMKLFNLAAFHYKEFIKNGFEGNRQKSYEHNVKYFKLYGPIVNYIVHGQKEVTNFPGEFTFENITSFKFFKTSIDVCYTQMLINHLYRSLADIHNEKRTGRISGNAFLYKAGEKGLSEIKDVSEEIFNYLSLYKSKFPEHMQNTLTTYLEDLNAQVNKLGTGRWTMKFMKWVALSWEGFNNERFYWERREIEFRENAEYLEKHTLKIPPQAKSQNKEHSTVIKYDYEPLGLQREGYDKSLSLPEANKKTI
ncbi:MAG: hypothetical protein J0H68_08125 [Sphingobacteriia bacterium]|nr:hypothetical protein [Sphingobacteriia bacterium]